MGYSYPPSNTGDDFIPVPANHDSWNMNTSSRRNLHSPLGSLCERRIPVSAQRLTVSGNTSNVLATSLILNTMDPESHGLLGLNMGKKAI